MAWPDTEDRLVTDPHGFAPVPPQAELPPQRMPHPQHDRWDPAYVPDPRQPAADPDDVFADERYAEPRHADTLYAEPQYPDERFAEPRYPDERFAEPRYADEGFDGSYDRDERYAESYDPDEQYADPRDVDARQAGAMYSDERYGDERYGEERYGDEWYGAEDHPDAFDVRDPDARRGGHAPTRHISGEQPVGRRARRRAREEGEARRGAEPPRPAQATFVGDPDDLEQDAGRLRFTTVAIPVAIGSLVAVGIGAWARYSDATGVAVNIAGFSSAGAVKTWLASAALVFALVQLWTAMMLRGRIGSGAGARTAMVHRWSGRIAVLITVPVAVQCLIAMGWSGGTTRTLVHSLLGCVFYGAFVTKMLLLRKRGVPGWLIAVFGGLLLAVLAGIWLTSALWFFGTKGLTF